MAENGRSDSDARIARAFALLERRFGPTVVRRLVVAPDRHGQAVSSGVLGLDLVTGLGGLPRGHVTEFFGPESSGKTALLYAALAAAQRAGGRAALIDAEGAADGETLQIAGVDLSALLLACPTSARDALLLATILARCDGLDALGLLSVPALRDLPYGTGRETPPALESIEIARLRDGPTAVLMTNLALAGPPENRSTGGYALRHFAALRVAVTPVMARILGVFQGGGEAAVMAAAMTAIGRVAPATVGRPEPGPYQVAPTTHHEQRPGPSRGNDRSVAP